MLDYYSGGYGYRIPKPGMMLRQGMDSPQTFSFRVWISVIRWMDMNQDAKSNLYKTAVPNNGKTIKFRAFDSKGRGGAVAE